MSCKIEKTEAVELSADEVVFVKKLFAARVSGQLRKERSDVGFWASCKFCMYSDKWESVRAQPYGFDRGWCIKKQENVTNEDGLCDMFLCEHKHRDKYARWQALGKEIRRLEAYAKEPAPNWTRDAEEAAKTCLSCSNKPTCDIDGEAKLTLDYEYAARDEDFFCKFWEKK